MIKNSVFNAFFILFNISLCFGCDISIKEADECGLRSMFFGNRNTIIPTNEQELDKHCAEVRDNVECINNFVDKCLEGLTQQVLKKAMSNSDKHIANRCKAPADRSEFILHVKCLLPREKMEPFHLCTDKYLIMLEKLKTVAIGDRVAVSCCLFHMFQNCIRDNNKAVCGEDTTEYWDRIISEMAEDSMAITCANYKTVEKCDKSLDPKMWNDIKSVADITDPNILTKHNFKSGIALTVEIISDFKIE